MSLRFAFLLDVLEIGGIQRQLVNVCRALVSRGDSVTVIAFRDTDKSMTPIFENAGCQVQTLNKQKRFDLRAFRKLRRFLTSKKFDLIQAMSPQIAFWAALFSPLNRGYCLIGSVLNTFFFRDRLSVLAEFLFTRHRLDGVVVNSRQAKQLYKSKISNNLPVGCIYNGVNLPDPPKTEKTPAPFTITSIGRLDPIKGHDVLFRALSLLPKDSPEWKLLLIGDGQIASNLKVLAKTLQLSDRIEFRGADLNPEATLTNTDLFVLPSRSEGLPNALLEAMAASLPCVATAVGGIPEISKNGRGFILVPANDPVSLANAISRIMKNPARASKLGKTAREIVSHKFSMEKMIQQTLTFYDNILERGNRSFAQ